MTVLVRQPSLKTRVRRLVKAAQDAGVGIAGIQELPDGSVFIRAGEPLDSKTETAERDPRVTAPDQLDAEIEAWEP